MSSMWVGNFYLGIWDAGDGSQECCQEEGSHDPLIIADRP